MIMQGKLTRTDFENALTPQALMTTQIIQIALTLGPLFFLGIVVFLFFQRLELEGVRPDEGSLQMLTIVQLFSLFAAGGISGVLRARLFSPDALGSLILSSDPREIAQQCVMQQRTATIVGLALLEGAAFFGLVVCMIGVTNGALQAFPYYWVNAISVLVLLVFSVTTFPTRGNLVNWFERAILQS
jgi:hypothetical protein